MCSENHLHFDYVRLAWDAGFYFEECNTKNAFDVSTLGLVDVEKVTRDRDIATVERHIPTILQFHLDEELTRILEPTFVKIFKLCQLALQYLRFCNKYLDNTVVILKKDLSISNDENINLSNIIDQLKTENGNLNIKNKELKEAFNNIHQSVSFKCHACVKSFASEEYLQAHILRRHDAQTTEMRSESEKLQLEIKELKERLNSTEKYIIHEKDEPNNDDVFGDKEVALQAKFEQLKEHIEKELRLLKDESFYKGIYEKCFEEVFEKLKGGGRVLVEQGSGDCVRMAESSTQTVAVGESGEGLKGIIDVDGKQAANERIRRIEMGEAAKDEIIDGSGDKVEANEKGEEKDTKELTNERLGEVEERTFGMIVEIEGRTIGKIEEVEHRLRIENEAQREMLEKMLEEKIVGGLGKLESQINDFGKKLQDFESKKQGSPNLCERAIRESNPDATKQLLNSAKNFEKRETTPKPSKRMFTPTKTNSRYIAEKTSTNLVSTSSDSESENIPPKPAQRNLDKPPVKTLSFQNREEYGFGNGRNELFLEKNEKLEESDSASDKIDGTPQQNADFKDNHARFKKVEPTVESQESTSEDSEEFRGIKVVQMNPRLQNEYNKTVLKENNQKDVKKIVVKEVVKKKAAKNPEFINKQKFQQINKSAIVRSKQKNLHTIEKSKEYPKGLVKEIKEKQKALVKKKIESKKPVVASPKLDVRKTVFNEEMLVELQEELEQVLNLRLKEIGVAPQWKGLPKKNYQHAIDIIEHQASLLSKSIPNYSKIRDGIVKMVNKNIKEETNKEYLSPKKGKQKDADNKIANDLKPSPDLKNETISDISTDHSSVASNESPELIKKDIKAASKKKVLFDLNKEDSVQVIKPIPQDFHGSVSSSGCSELDENTKKGAAEKREESDWDISDIPV